MHTNANGSVVLDPGDPAYNPSDPAGDNGASAAGIYSSSPVTSAIQAGGGHAPQSSIPAAGNAPATGPVNTGTATAPYASTTIGYNGNQGLAGTQQPGIFGTGTFVANPYAINDQAITGAPAQGADQNYGLNDVMGRLQTEVNGLQPKSYQATAPQAQAAQGTAAMGSAAQAQAAQGTASGYSAALGGPASVGQVSGQAALGQAALAQAAQMRAAQGGYATSGPTQISTAGDAAFQAQQQGLANTLSTQANGGGVSPADLQLQQGTEQQIAGQLAVLGSQRGGGNAALVQRSAATQAAAAQQNLNQQLGIQRAQETLNAQNALGSVLGTARGQAQGYNANQAQLTQQTSLANAANAQAATMQNTGFGQQAAQFNAGNAQQTALANQASQNQLSLANLAAQNQQLQQNQTLAQQANEYNAGNSQAMTLANLAAQNTASQYNAGNAQNMTLANLAAQNAMTGQNLTAQNQFGLNDVENAQQTSLANLANQQQQTLANQSLAGQYGLANQSTALSAQNQYNQQLLALLGAQSSLGQANRSASLADQQLQVQQQMGANQVNAGAYEASAQANANLAGSAFSTLGSLASAGINALGSSGSSGGGGSSSNPDVGGAEPTTADPTGDSLALSPYQNPRLAQTLSDENAKEGIAGGNPMLASFLEQYRAHQSKDDIDVMSGTHFQGPTSMRGAGTAGGASAGKAIGSSIGGTLGGAAAGAAAGSVVPGIGTVIGGAIGAFLGSQAGGAIGGAVDPGSPGSAGATTFTPASGYQPIGVSDDDMQSMSDDQAKENVMSGNRGLQQFLEQASAQTGAQNQQGARSNAFMQTGQAPATQVDRQMTPGMVNAGYGASPQLFGPQMMGGAQPGGVSSYGGSAGGGFASMGGYGGGGVSPSAMGGMGGVSAGGLPSMGGMAQGPGLSSAGSLSQLGGVMPGGGYNPTPPAPIQAPAPYAAARANSPFTGATWGPVSTPAPMAATTSPVAGLTPQSVGAQPQFVAATPSRNPLFALSDEDEKSHVTDPSPRDLQPFLDALHAHQYRYKDPEAAGAGHGTFVSPMAQELEETPLGRHFVFDGPEGRKMVDYGKMSGTLLAGQAMLNERLNSVETMLSRSAADRSRAGRQGARMGAG